MLSWCYQPSMQSHIENHPMETLATSVKDHCSKASWFQSRKEHHRANIKPANPHQKVPTPSTGSASCLHRI